MMGRCADCCFADRGTRFPHGRRNQDPFLAPGYNDSNVTYCRLCWPFLAKPADDEPPAEDPGGFAI